MRSMSSATLDVKGDAAMTLAIRSVTFPQSAETGPRSARPKARLSCEGRIRGVEVEVELLFPWPLFDERLHSNFREIEESLAATLSRRDR